ncbi:hypothetical protein COV61_05610 [Candidatus Micrarchaeota archaeon CG11_big_fil_rev_8_21_14_0_20_47_5]|nr:MAG: hypothetical protein AUJ17_02555 [Candidatus Micrarchaeota archaeon CG1_02_47_40]PIN82574.1 MAG: hypothetical protein COV61_05610 [Candidatus Micrarchaeota archaeon CG11_big_fil_rev_8_21_14_0_20_47_5]
MAEKKVSVKLLGEAKDEYLHLQEIVKDERKRCIKSSFHQTLLKSIDSKLAIMKTNYDYGVQIPRRAIPAKYLQGYGVTNLWKVDLSGYWRMIYTLKQPQREQAEIEIISIWLDVLDIIDHPKYDKVFGYRKR